MSALETEPDKTARYGRSQLALLLCAVGLFALAGAGIVMNRSSWSELYREWTAEVPDVADLDREFDGRGTGQIKGVPHGEVEIIARPAPLAAGAVTSDWTQLLGPNNNCTSPETHLRKDWEEAKGQPWSGGPNLLWTRNIGATYAAPAVQGDRLIHFHRYGDQEIVTCLNPADGEELWQYGYPTDYQDRYGFGGGPKCAPVIDGDRVYTYGVEGRLHCLNLKTGKLVWERSPLEEYNLSQNFFGVGDAPLVEGDLLVVTVGAPQGPCVAAYDKLTGKTVWGVGDGWRAGYAAPVAATVHGERRVFVFAGGETTPPAGGLMVVDPVEGKEVFRFPWRSRVSESVNASSPVVVGNEVFISTSYGLGGTQLTINPDGTYEQRWTTKDLATHWMTPVHKDGYLYGFDGYYENEAALVCLEWATGKLMWRERIEWTEEYFHGGQMREDKTGTGRASLLFVDGHFLCLGERGHLLWLDLSPEGYEIISRAWLVPGRNIWGMPVVSQGLLFINQTELTLELAPPRLLCFDLRAPADG